MNAEEFLASKNGDTISTDRQNENMYEFICRMMREYADYKLNQYKALVEIMQTDEEAGLYDDKTFNTKER